MTAAAPNAQMREYWSSPVAEHWVDAARRYDDMLDEFGQDVLTAVAPATGESVLDIGCGTGPLGVAAARLVAPGRVVGVDISEQMIGGARARAERDGVANAAFEVADAQVHLFEAAAFDIVVSRFGVMFFDDPVAAFTNLRTAIKPGGRLGFTCWQSVAENPWVATPVGAVLEHVDMPEAFGEGPSPFALADPDHVRSILTDAGFGDVHVEARARPLLIGGGGTLEETFAFISDTGMVQRLLADVPEDAAARAVAAVREALTPHLTDDGVVLGSATWLVTASN